MAYDSFAGGLARGFANAQQMRLQREERERLDKIANLEGKLTEAKLKQLQNEQTAKNDLSAYLGGIRSDNLRADLQAQRPGQQLVNPKQLTVDRMSTDPRNVSGMGMPPQKREEPSILDILSRFPNLPAEMRDSLIDIGKLRRQKEMDQMIRGFMPGGLSQNNMPSLGQNMIPGAQTVPSGGLASIPNAADYQPEMGVRSLRFSESGERLIPTIAKPEVGKVVLMLDPESGQAFNVQFSKKGAPMYKTPAYESKVVKNTDGSESLVVVQPGAQQPGVGSGGPPGSATDNRPVGTQTAPGVFDKPPPDGTTNFINAEGQTVGVDLERATVRELNQAGFYKAPKTVIEAFRLADETLRNIEVLEGQWMALTQQGGAGGIAARPKGGLADRVFKQPAFNLNNPAFTREQIDRGELDNSTFMQTLNDRLDYITSKNPAMRLYFDNYLSTAVSLARAEGEVGALAEGDIARALKKLPFPGLQIDDRGDVRLFTLQRRDDPVTAKGKFEEAKRKIREKGLLNDWRNRFKGQQSAGPVSENEKIMQLIDEIEAEVNR